MIPKVSLGYILLNFFIEFWKRQIKITSLELASVSTLLKKQWFTKYAEDYEQVLIYFFFALLMYNGAVKLNALLSESNCAIFIKILREYAR